MTQLAPVQQCLMHMESFSSHLLPPADDTPTFQLERLSPPGATGPHMTTMIRVALCQAIMSSGECVRGGAAAVVLVFGCGFDDHIRLLLVGGCFQPTHKQPSSPPPPPSYANTTRHHRGVPHSLAKSNSAV
ncbi:hypothetical protein DI09_401p10 [Mitosporidium daphniae]|uniref:Uncharacterized protein n=1 Tax=Mitosporidium daphniae TaxID=1485682 RepID=A0A098VR92_9MICR|nr:uncharacterized protein DI09_401p10 [Mitosporidium daphniae]KGG51324.1 hypothetical protein DI09_401p10 [Mitosporidium daphniae]|eukprot:XP_013237760.1 uncharacterized protein DI09_401p10 [Mitosporidium daphniae]